jgi:hypothetical protein
MLTTSLSCVRSDTASTRLTQEFIHWGIVFILVLLVAKVTAAGAPGEGTFQGRHYSGTGDVEYLRLLETARRMFEPDAELQNLTMLYEPKWNGLVEGPTWDAWWIQNSYGTTYSILPLLREPFLTFLQNAQDLWFDQMGDGKRVGASPPFDWVAPDGCLCDAARPGWIVYKQGDGRTAIHDWGIEFTAAGVVLQSELLLISRDSTAIARYLPKLERSVEFIESRRDPGNDLFLAGPAGNLLAPSYAGWRRPDGSYDKAYLAGLSVTYIAALDRVVELEKLARHGEKVALYSARRDSARRALRLLTTDEGYFIRSLDPDGVRHGVFGAGKHGYFEASPNHDAIALRVVDDAQAERIYRKMASIPGLRPNVFILPNYPSYDDMYEKPEGLWAYGTWVNGGHWSTCEARMILAYYRLGRFEDARSSMRQLLGFASRFRMDNPLTHCGAEVYQPNQPINLCYDTFGPAAAFMRGLFEYLYSAEELRLVPHVPSGVTELTQHDPVRFGRKRLLISTRGKGAVTGVRLNGRQWRRFDAQSVFLPYERLPELARVEILLGQAKPSRGNETDSRRVGASRDWVPTLAALSEEAPLRDWRRKLELFQHALEKSRFGDTREAAHARLALDAIEQVGLRRRLQAAGAIQALPKESQAAADRSFVEAATRLCDGLARLMTSYKDSDQPGRRGMARMWDEAAQ